MLAFKQSDGEQGRPAYLWPRTTYVLPTDPMNTQVERLQAAQAQVSRFTREHVALRKRVVSLESDVQDHQRMVDMLKARVSELERENEVLRSAKSAESRQGDPGTKEKIDELVNEIDRCLALINA
jgi:predicted RNase H-like nuclease (RuvC/YqgF family)